MTETHIALDSNIIRPTPIAYPTRNYTLTCDPSRGDATSTFPVVLDVTTALEISATEKASLPTYYREALPSVYFAASHSKFRGLTEDYPDQVAILALSDTSDISNVVRCGKIDGRIKRGLCNKARVCPYCARNKTSKRWAGFKKLYTQAEWSILTVSYDGHMTYSEFDHTRWIIHWDAATSAIKRMVRSNYFSGAFVKEELSLHQYIPQQVKPHVHVIISQSPAQLDPNWEKVLRSFIDGYRDEDGNKIDLPIDISLEPIDSFEHFNRTFYYTQKAIDLVAPYRSFLNQNPEPNETILATLNRASRDFVESFLTGSYNRTQIVYLGDLDSKNQRYLAKSNIYQSKP